MPHSPQRGLLQPSPSAPQGRAERWIGVGRLVLAALALLAFPRGPAAAARPVLYLVAAYAAYALLLALLVWRGAAPWRRLGGATHAVDLTVFTVLYLTQGPSSPFVLSFVFALLSATLRWQWRGTLWTGAFAMASVLGLGGYSAAISPAPTSALRDVALASGALAAVAALLSCLGAHAERLRTEMARLAAWPHAMSADAEALVRDLLKHAAGILGAPQALLAWEEPEEPWLHLALWASGEFRWTREPPATFQPLVAAPLAGTDFLCLDLGAPCPTVLHTAPAGLKRWSGAPLHPGLQTRFALQSVLAAALRGESLEGRLFVWGRPGLTAEDLVLGGIVAREVAARLDHFALVQQVRQAAATEERIRLARELHDGVLQSLTGAALQLQTVQRLLPQDPQEAQARLEAIQRLIADEQRDLRFFVQELRPAPLGAAEAPLAARLGALVERFENVWGLRVELHTDGLPDLPEGLAQEIPRLLREALVNAAKHAQASAVRVELGTQGQEVRLTVADNGRGFTFRGHYDHAALTALKLGPVALKGRIAALGGSLAIDSTEAGSCLEIRLPLPGAHDGH